MALRFGAALLLTIGVTCSTQAQVTTTLYSDDFDGDGLLDLSGTTPDITVDANVWESGSTVFKNDGTVDGGSAQSGVWLPFTPEPDNVYTLTATIDSQEAEGNWISLGFSREAAAVDDRAVDIASTATLWIRGATAADNEAEFLHGDWPGVEGTVTGLTVPAPHDVKIVMDTTDANVANWTTEFFIDDVQVGAPAVGETPYTGIQWVGFTTTNMAGAVDDFLLMSEGLAPEDPRDVNGDGTVDEFDYFDIRDNLFEEVGVGIAGKRRGNIDNTGSSFGVTDFADFRFWKEGAPASALIAAGLAVPEPASVFLGLACVVMFTVGRYGVRS